MDDSIDILSTESEYNILKSNIALLENDLETKNQLIYDFKKQIELATALEGDYQQEIETLSSNNNGEVLQLKKTIKELEEYILTLRNASNLDLLGKTELIDDLKSKINEIPKNTSKEGQIEENLKEKDHEKNKILKEELVALSAALEAMETRIGSIEVQNANLEETNNELLIEVDHTKQHLKCKMQELTETKNLIQNLQEDLFLMEHELESMKNKPLDAAKKGNSLFGEVEDSCIQTQQNIQQLKKKYSELKRDLCSKLKQLNTITARNSELCQQLNCIETCDEEYEKVIEGYRIKEAALESAVEDCKHEVLKEQKYLNANLPVDSVEFANATLSAKWKTGVKLRDELNCESKKKLETFINIKTANVEMREWRRKAQELKIKIEKLENIILQMELNSPTGNSNFKRLLESPIKETPPISSIPKCSEIIADLSTEKILNTDRSTITIRKKSVFDDRSSITQQDQSTSN